MARGSRPALERPPKKRLGGRDIRFGAEQEVDSFPIAVDRAIEVSYLWAPRKIGASLHRANQIQDSHALSAGGCMGQLGFFDLNRRYESLTEKNDPLVAIAAMVPFESFRPS